MLCSSYPVFLDKIREAGALYFRIQKIIKYLEYSKLYNFGRFHLRGSLNRAFVVFYSPIKARKAEYSIYLELY